VITPFVAQATWVYGTPDGIDVKDAVPLVGCKGFLQVALPVVFNFSGGATCLSQGLMRKVHTKVWLLLWDVWIVATPGGGGFRTIVSRPLPLPRIGQVERPVALTSALSLRLIYATKLSLQCKAHHFSTRAAALRFMEESVGTPCGSNAPSIAAIAACSDGTRAVVRPLLMH